MSIQCDLCGDEHGVAYNCQSPQAIRSRELKAEREKDPRDREIERLRNALRLIEVVQVDPSRGMTVYDAIYYCKRIAAKAEGGE